MVCGMALNWLYCVAGPKDILGHGQLNVGNKTNPFLLEFWYMSIYIPFVPKNTPINDDLAPIRNYVALVWLLKFSTFFHICNCYDDR